MAFTTQFTDNSIICTVPVTVPDISEFCQRLEISPDIPRMAGKIRDFVSKKLAEFGVKKEVMSFDIQEMLKNSVDSFISSGTIEEGSALVFSAVVKQDGKNIVIKFKDNGKGVDREGKRFEVYELRSTKKCLDKSKKYPYAYFGELGLGLKGMNERIQAQGGTVWLKNRKIAGCTVHVKFGLIS